MLYGMDDYDEFGLKKKQKLNLKKVAIVIVIILLCLLLGFVTFSVSYKVINQSENQNNLGINNEYNNNSTINNNVVLSNGDIKGEQNVYLGNHFQIPNHNMEKIELEFLPQLNENAQDVIKDIYKSNEKQIYLTFDDGPSKDITPKILDILKEYDVKATFFVLGARVELYPDTLRREFEEGHYIANHGYSHEYKKIYQNRDTVFQEYVDCENSIKKALNNQSYSSYLFRFPGGSSGGKYEKVKAQARELFSTYGVAYTNWNCLTGDAEDRKTKEECITKMLETKGDNNSIILLMHDANDKQQTVDALPDIIQYFKNEGYAFKNFYEIF